MAMMRGLYRKVQPLRTITDEYCRRLVHTTLKICSSSPNGYNFPTPGSDLPYPAGIASMMRLPIQKTSEGLDACFVGVTLDSGTCNRSGTRFGPRQIRSESIFAVRPFNFSTGAAPFESLRVADTGDVNLNMYNLPEACNSIRDHYRALVKDGCIPLTMGGDHTITYPILQAIKEKHGPVGLVHIDAHDDIADDMSGAKISHGTPFRRAAEEDCLVGPKVFQIGLRGHGYAPDDYQFGLDRGFNIIRIEDCWHRSLVPLLAKIREIMGSHPVYISFDIDSLDPSIAPGTGTPEIGGLTTIQALEIIRGCRGMNVVGCDLVEVSPPYDTTGNTALTAANLMFEMLCILPNVKYKEAFESTFKF
ncbi:unnamed protein product [Owenia fusiformis]|uniref:Uncharacterized protein n=1 Tax=Owenia fusiformis TaxID=6347 RepID=A0A8J1TXE3_OWEFU|nr:unnamed protein product [Owenia fusiformis]